MVLEVHTCHSLIFGSYDLLVFFGRLFIPKAKASWPCRNSSTLFWRSRARTAAAVAFIVSVWMANSIKAGMFRTMLVGKGMLWWDGICGASKWSVRKLSHTINQNRIGFRTNNIYPFSVAKSLRYILDIQEALRYPPAKILRLAITQR